jgi:SAM-dependent methyltransferase
MTQYNFHFQRRPAETSKAHARRLSEGMFDKYCRGLGIDIGCGNDPIDPGDDREVYMFDMIHGQGDATFLHHVGNERFDYVHSSHLLEHIADDATAIKNWWRVLKPGGYMILLLPERDLYEKKRTLPSNWNGDHKRFYLLDFYDPPHTVGLVHWLGARLAPLGPGMNYKILSARTLQEEPDSPPHVHSGGEYSIEVVIKKLR